MIYGDKPTPWNLPRLMGRDGVGCYRLGLSTFFSGSPRTFKNGLRFTVRLHGVRDFLGLPPWVKFGTSICFLIGCFGEGLFKRHFLKLRHMEFYHAFPKGGGQPQIWRLPRSNNARKDPPLGWEFPLFNAKHVHTSQGACPKVHKITPSRIRIGRRLSA